MPTYLKQPCDEGVVLSAPAAAPCPSDIGTWVLVTTILGSSMASIDGTVVNVALPVLQTDLGATVAGAQWVIEGYSLFLGALILVGGGFGDRVGRRLVYAAGTALFTVASILCGVAPNLGVLIAARAVQGIGAALLVPGSLAIISAVFPAERRGKAIGTWAAFSAITTGLGPVLGGWLIEHVSWRAIFFINLPLAAVVLFLTFWRVPESRDEEATGGLDWPGACLATLGLGGLVFGLVQGSGSAPRGLVVVSLAAGVLALLAFVWVEMRAAAPMMPLAMFRSPTFLGANVLTLLLYGALGGALFFVPFDLIQVQGYSATAAGGAFLPFILLMFLLSRWTGGLVDRVGAKPPLVVGPTIAAAGLLLFALPDVGGSYWTTFFPAVVVMSLGMSIAVAPLTTVVMNAVGGNHAGAASGVNNAASRVAGLLAIAVFGIVAVQVFSRNMNDRVSSLHLTGPVRRALTAQHDRLVATQIPGGLDGATAAAVHRAVAESFVGTFRVLMVIGAVMAVLSALSAAALIEGGRPHPERAAEPARQEARVARA